jgi:hypothetical protein
VLVGRGLTVRSFKIQTCLLGSLYFYGGAFCAQVGEIVIALISSEDTQGDSLALHRRSHLKGDTSFASYHARMDSGRRILSLSPRIYSVTRLIEHLAIVFGQQSVDVFVNLRPFLSDGFVLLLVPRIHDNEIGRAPAVVSQVFVIQ